MTKSKITMVMLAITISWGGYAQNGTDTETLDSDFRKQLMFGLKAGVNYSNVYDERGDAFKANPKFGLATGFFLAIPIGKFVGIQPELLFSQKGFKATGQLLGREYEITRTTNYIDVPIYFALKPSPYFTLLAGPQYSFLISQKNKFENATTSIEQEEAFDNDNIRKNTLCFSAGADIILNHWVLNGRVGLDVLDNNGDGSSSTPRYKNVWYQLTVGFLLY